MKEQLNEELNEELDVGPGECCDSECAERQDPEQVIENLKQRLEEQEKFYVDQHTRDIHEYNKLAKAFNTLLREYNELHVKLLLPEDK